MILINKKVQDFLYGLCHNTPCNTDNKKELFSLLEAEEPSLIIYSDDDFVKNYGLSRMNSFDDDLLSDGTLPMKNLELLSSIKYQTQLYPFLIIDVLPLVIATMLFSHSILNMPPDEEKKQAISDNVITEIYQTIKDILVQNKKQIFFTDKNKSLINALDLLVNKTIKCIAQDQNIEILTQSEIINFNKHQQYIVTYIYDFFKKIPLNSIWIKQLEALSSKDNTYVSMHDWPDSRFNKLATKLCLVKIQNLYTLPSAFMIFETFFTYVIKEHIRNNDNFWREIDYNPINTNNAILICLEKCPKIIQSLWITQLSRNLFRQVVNYYIKQQDDFDEMFDDNDQ